MKHFAAIQNEFKKYAVAQLSIGKPIESIVDQGIVIKQLPFSITVRDNVYNLYLVNGDEYTLTKNGEIVFATPDAIMSQLLSKLNEIVLGG